MGVTVHVNGKDHLQSHYIGWAPVKCDITIDDEFKRKVVLRNESQAIGSGVVQFSKSIDGGYRDELSLNLSQGQLETFYIKGKFGASGGFPSSEKDDASFIVHDKERVSKKLLRVPVMVRVRKNANNLSSAERDRFLSAMVQLNSQPKYEHIQNMHTSDANREIHSRSCFLPWHRAYLLDLERSLQAIDPSVTLPYWKFDEKAENVFRPAFMGQPASASTDRLNFSENNPLISWNDRSIGVGNRRLRRREYFNPRENGANISNDEDATMLLGRSGASHNYDNFRSSMEGDPHGMAHGSFDGDVSDIGKAPADPLFFLIHCNVDRLWAKWQWTWSKNHNLFDATKKIAYDMQGSGPSNDINGRRGDVGNFIDDTMWPWNKKKGGTRPPTAPGGHFPASDVVDAPGKEPTVGSMMDFMGHLKGEHQLGFYYDDIPFESDAPNV